MKKATFILSMMIALGAQGQNFVPNFSFEFKTACPVNNICPYDGIDDFRKAEPWMSYAYSPDLYDPCVDDPNLWGDVPNTGGGYQVAFDGVSFAGFLYSRTDGNDNYSEILGCPLIGPLTIGERYSVSIRVSVSDYRLNASNHLGVLFLTHGYDALTNPMTFPDRCHVCADSVITDYIGWSEISGVIIADSAYTHIAIGHFLDSTTYVVLPGAPGVGGPYYFVDFVCVVPEGGDCATPLITGQLQPHQPATFTAYPNPIIKSQSPILHFSKESSVEVYDLMGQVMGHYENVLEVDTGGWPVGVYLVRESGGGTVTKIIVME